MDEHEYRPKRSGNHDQDEGIILNYERQRYNGVRPKFSDEGANIPLSYQLEEESELYGRFGSSSELESNKTLEVAQAPEQEQSEPQIYTGNDKTGTIEGGSAVGGLLNDVDPLSRNVSLQVFKEPEGEVDQTWVIIHGWNSSLQGDNIKALIEKTVAVAGENDRVLALDWREASNNSGSRSNDPPSPENNRLAVAGGGNGIAATWIAPTAEKTVEMLKEFGINSTNADQNLNLIGHSLGSFVSAEIGQIYKTGEGRQGKPLTTANDKGVRTITALDPASVGLVGGGYDVDGRTEEVREAPANFAEVAEFSRAFVGSKSIAGSKKFAGNADETYLLDFNDPDSFITNSYMARYGILPEEDFLGEHGGVVRAFTNILDNSGKIGELLGFNSYQSLNELPTEGLNETEPYQGTIYIGPDDEPTAIMN